MTTIKTNAGGSSDVTLDDGSQTTAKNTVTISGNIKFTNSVYSQVTLSDGKQTTAMNVVNLSDGGGTDAVTSVNGVQPVDGNVEITGDNITATVGEEKATITQHLTTLQQSINGKQDALTTEQLAAVNSGITSAKVASYDAYAGEISTAQSTANKADGAAEVAQQTANLAGQNAAQALSGLASKVNIAQGTENTGNVLAVDGSGNVVPTAGYATQSWVETQITNSIGSIETALAEV